MAPRLSVYKGPGKVAEVNSFQTWLGRSQVDATDYADTSENTQWNQYELKYWGDWKKAKADRQFTLGLHMIPKGGNFKDGLAGKYDSQFTNLTKLLTNNGLGDSVVRLGYEPNNPGIGPWQGTQDPASYKAMWQRVYGVMKKQAPGLKFDYNLAVGQSGKATSFDSLYPGDSYVDIVGLNIYDVWWQHPSATPAQRWQHTVDDPMGLNAFRAFATAHNKPYSFPEWGLYKPGDNYAGGGDNPYFIDRMAEAVVGAQYQAYFDLDWGGGVMSDFPKGKAEYKLKLQTA